MDLYLITIYFGVLTYALLIFTILLGKRIIKLNFKFHKIFAIITLISASCHAGLVVYMNYF